MGDMEDDIFDGFAIPQWIEEVENMSKLSKKGKGYKRMHETANNRVIPISVMSDNHLENFINLMMEKMESIKSQALYEVGESGDLFAMELNGVQKMDRATAVIIISNIMYKLEPYLTELVIRGNNRYIMNISEKLNKILSRKTITGQNLLK
jgi:hypothetical protein